VRCNLVESGGAFLPAQDEVFPDREKLRPHLYNQATLSALGVAQISVVHGSCTGGRRVRARDVDENVIVRNQGRVFLGGPPLVKAATGEDIDADPWEARCALPRIGRVRPLRGERYARARHCAAHRQRACRRGAGRAAADAADPRHDPAELYGVLPANLRKPYDVREVIARLVDASELDGVQAALRHDPGMRFAHLCGYPVGILANNGVLFSESALKGTHFIELCSREQIPLLFLQNITGFMVGRRAEAGGIAKDGAKLVTA